MGTVSSIYYSPKEYQSDYCGELVRHMGSGYSFESFGGEVCVGLRTLYKWREEHPEFAAAEDAGMTAYIQYWEGMGILGQRLNNAGGMTRLQAIVWKWHMARIRRLSRIDMMARVEEQVYKAREMMKMKYELAAELEVATTANELPATPMETKPEVQMPVSADVDQPTMQNVVNHAVVPPSIVMDMPIEPVYKPSKMAMIAMSKAPIPVPMVKPKLPVVKGKSKFY